MKTIAVLATISLLVAACSGGDDSVIPDAGEAGTDATTGNDATQDVTAQDVTQDTTTSDVANDGTVSDSASDAPSDTGLPDVLAAHCTNNTQDVDETDIDCGGLVCNKCTTGKKCLVGTDCTSGVCKGNKTCQ